MDVGLSLLKTWTIGALAVSVWLSWGTQPAAGRAKCAAERERLPSSTAELNDPSQTAGSPAPPLDQLLLRLARSDNTEELCELFATLPASAEPAVTYAIVDVLDRARARAVRLCATEALGRQTSAEAVSYLVELIDADDPDVQAQALSGLLGSGSELGRASALEAAHSEEPRLRHSAVLALLRAKHPAAFELAQQQLTVLDDSASLGELAVALGVSGDERALPALLLLLERGDRDVHLSALEGLGKLGSKAAIPALTALLAVGSHAEFNAAATALAEIEPELALQSLVAATQGDNAKRRGLAVSAIASLSPSAGRKRALFELARSSEPSLAVEALRALGADHDAEAEPLLLEAARSESFELRHTAASALARFDSPAAVAQLRVMLQDDVHEVAENALGILGSRPGVGEAERRQALAAGEVKLTPHAMRLLALDEAPEAQSALLDQLTRAPAEPSELGMVLGQVPVATLDVLVRKYATDADDSRRFCVISALSERAEPRFEPTLRAALRDERADTRRRAVGGLIGMGSNDANALLDGLLASSDVDDKKLGYELLSGHGDAASLERLQASLEREGGNADLAEATEQGVSFLKSVAPARAARVIEALYERSNSEQRVALLQNSDGLGTLALATCKKGLASDDRDVLTQALSLVEQLALPGLAEQVVSIARDTERDASVRQRAASALRALGGSSLRQNQRLVEELEGFDGTPAPFRCPWDRT